MSDGVEWMFKLIDGISGPADKMKESIKGLEGGLKHSDDAIKSSHEGTGKHTEGVFGKMTESVKSFAEGFFFVTESIKTSAELIEGVFDRVGESTAKIFELADFRRNALIGLDAMLSTGYQATAVLERLEGWAKQTGMAKDTFTVFGKQLLGAGFHEGELKPLLAALSDVQGANEGKVAASQELFELMKRIHSTDKVNDRELVAFAGLGIKPEGIYAALAQQQHKSLAQAKALFAGGNVGGTDAVNAVLGAISGGMDHGAALGAKGQSWAAGSVFAQMTKLKDSFSTLFEGVNEAPFANALARVSHQLQGADGEKFTATLNAGFAKVGEWVGHLDFVKISDGVGKFADGLQTAAVFVGQVFDGFMLGWNDVSPALSAMGEAIGAVFGMDGAGSDVKMFAQAIGDVVGAFVLVGSVAVFAVGLVGRSIVMLVEGISWLVGAMADVGTNIVGGLWSGIKAAWAGMLSEFHALIEMLPAAVKHVLGIASPSRVFAGLGAHTMEGFSVGMRSVPVHERMGEMMNPRSLDGEMGAFRPNAMSLGELSRGGGGGRSIQLSLSAPIHIDGSKDPHATADAMIGEMKRVFLPELAAAFDQLNIEAGG